MGTASSLVGSAELKLVTMTQVLGVAGQTNANDGAE